MLQRDSGNVRGITAVKQGEGTRRAKELGNIRWREGCKRILVLLSATVLIPLR